jgi:multidrug resistance efflux pump|tara:strand:+ start:861 stop:1214 length:354 start_codon:yes stop_codon:yes gene_type:complete
MEISKLESQLYKLASSVETLGEEHAIAKGEYENIKDLSKDILASMMMEEDVRASSKTSEAKLERLARCSKGWVKHREGLFNARTKFLQVDAKLIALKLMHESIRSILSVEKEKMKMI